MNKTSLDAHIKRLEQKRTELMTSYKSSDPDHYKKSKKYRSLSEAISTGKAIITQLFQLQDNAKKSEDLVAYVEDMKTENPAMAQFMVNVGKTAKKHTENSKKVYQFVRKIADECLGKKFLVRLPKSCNLNYNARITTFNGTDPYNVKSGPFGFAPRPINADPNYAASRSFKRKIDALKTSHIIDEKGLFHHYLEDYADTASPTTSKGTNGNARLGSSDRYSQGALKGNYNPFSEKWEWNYKPEPQGGFYSHSLLGTSFTSLDYANGTVAFSALPIAIQQGLMPIDTKNLLSDSNRLQCYVKYNNSHTLDFTGVNAQDMTQQTTTEAGQFVPDIIEDLPNNNIDAETSFGSMEELKKDQIAGISQPDSVAFVKCSVEEVLYLPPKLEEKDREVWANIYDMKFAVPEVEIFETIEKEIAADGTETCTTKSNVHIPRSLPIFGVPKDGGSDSFAAWTDFKRVYDKNLKAWIIDTKIPNLDDEHVYVLITVPGRIKSTIDVRWRDGPKQAHNAVQIKHLMTQDVVKIPEFKKPSMPKADINSVTPPCGNPPEFKWDPDANNIDAVIDAAKALASTAASGYGLKGFHRGKSPNSWSPGLKSDWIRLTLEEVSSARTIAKIAQRGANFAQPQIKMGFSSPSPIFPDIVVIPLMSEERCYGPWMSASQLDFSADSRVKYSNIGGRVEFVKDENLAPWNYAGYQLMDEAGSLKANFSNSLLLFSERGGFVMPDAPTGIALASALKAGGPLITSIGISVGEGGVKTTIKMDLYTSSFGKLQKQKEMSISQVAREKQKALDERNSAIRRGLGKRQTSSDLVNTVMQAGGQKLLDKAAEIAAQVKANEGTGKAVEKQMLILDKDGGTSATDQGVADAMSALSPGEVHGAMQNSVAVEVAALWQAGSSRPSSSLPSEVASTQGLWADQGKHT
jgi:hypothetical protein